jgi:uncharacterized membrane protein
MDFGWIMLNKDLYLGTIKAVQKSEHKLTNISYIFMTYIVMLLGLFIICMTFVEKQIERYKNINKNIIAFISGGFYGIIINSIYNFTSLVAYKDYSLKASIIDIIWAIVLYGTASILYVNL